MLKSEKKWALIIFLVILLAYILPYTVFTDVTKWYGSFFVWVILTSIVIVLNIIMTKGWGK